MSDKRPMNVWEFLDGIDWMWVGIILITLGSFAFPVIEKWISK